MDRADCDEDVVLSNPRLKEVAGHGRFTGVTRFHGRHWRAVAVPYVAVPRLGPCGAD